MLIYGAAGWMSVQIAGSERPAMDAHTSRPATPHSVEDAQRETRVLDTYYAYVATWDYDAATSAVTHHVKISLIPGETDKTYSQTIHREGDYLRFTIPRNDLGSGSVQEKVWQRVK